MDTATRQIFLEFSRNCGNEGAVEREKLENAVDGYSISGPLGSQDPVLPVELDDLEDKLLGRGNSIRESWKKNILYIHSRTLDKHCPPPHI